MSHNDIALLFEDISLARSIVPPHATCARPALLRWDPSLPLSLENCIVAEYKEAESAVKDVFGVSAAYNDESVVVVDAHGATLPEGIARNGRRPEDVWGGSVAEVVEKRVAEVKKFEEWALS